MTQYAKPPFKRKSKGQYNLKPSRGGLLTFQSATVASRFYVMLSLKRRADFPLPATKRFKLPRYRKSRLTFLDDIPAEIRNKIYELLLVVAEPIDTLSLACLKSF